MNLLQALKWADDNAQGEVVDRLRSRKVAKVLSATVRTYAAWIREEGERSNTCTYNVLGEVCGYCECKRKASNAELRGARDCGEAGHDEGRCGNASCLGPNA